MVADTPTVDTVSWLVRLARAVPVPGSADVRRLACTRERREMRYESRGLPPRPRPPRGGGGGLLCALHGAFVYSHVYSAGALALGRDFSSRNL